MLEPPHEHGTVADIIDHSKEALFEVGEWLYDQPIWMVAVAIGLVVLAIIGRYWGKKPRE